MTLFLNIPDEVISAIERGEGRSLEEILKYKVSTLYKKHRPRRPLPGRPKFSPEKKRQSALVKELKGVFRNLRETFPTDFQTLYGPLEQRLKDAISSGDLETIEWFILTKPWLHSEDLPSTSQTSSDQT